MILERTEDLFSRRESVCESRSWRHHIGDSRRAQFEGMRYERTRSEQDIKLSRITRGEVGVGRAGDKVEGALL